MKGKQTYTKAESEQFIDLIRQKLNADPTTQKSIRNKIRKLGFYASDFGLRGGYNVDDFLRVVQITNDSNFVAPTANPRKAQNQKTKVAARKDSDESYIINLCDQVLNRKAIPQHSFDFLKGDAGTKLPVDAYYPDLNLVIEFMERQHTGPVKFFDKRKTVSGISRSEQRKKYDALRRKLIPSNGLKLVIFDYTEFDHSNRKKLLRNGKRDLKVVQNKLRFLVMINYEMKQLEKTFCFALC